MVRLDGRFSFRSKENDNVFLFRPRERLKKNIDHRLQKGNLEYEVSGHESLKGASGNTVYARGGETMVLRSPVANSVASVGKERECSPCI